ncbi:YciI family protein [Pseudonocardia aurantiaca]|uniref:YciI family protein n=1 Tax=Pseudonocardia aurantiaca TaxID=75290 RepID=A0ABW4FNW5_9PSEU
MRYIVLLTGHRPTDAPPELMKAIMELGAEASASGALLDTAGLAPATDAARVELREGHLSVMDGPFTEAKEVISYAIYDVRSKEEAVEWARRFMAVHQQHVPEWDAVSDVLRLMGPEDFGPPA